MIKLAIESYYFIKYKKKIKIKYLNNHNSYILLFHKLSKENSFDFQNDSLNVYAFSP